MEQLITDLVRSSSSLGQFGLVPLAAAIFIISLTFLPRPPVCIVAGLVYGMSAFPVVLAASTLGAAAGFILSRHLFQARFRQLLEQRPRWRSLVDAIDSEGIIIVVLLRLASPVPGSATTYLLGLSGIRPWPYIAATFLGLAPQTFLLVLIGAAGPAAFDSHGTLSTIRLLFVIAGVVMSVILIWLIGKKVRTSLSARLEFEHDQP